MRSYILTIFLVLAVSIVSAQGGFSAPSGLGGEVITGLPDMDYSFSPQQDTMYCDSAGYYSFFEEDEEADIPEIDFESYCVAVVYQCHYCLLCPVDRQQCHRNACVYSPRLIKVRKPY